MMRTNRKRKIGKQELNETAKHVGEDVTKNKTSTRLARAATASCNNTDDDDLTPQNSGVMASRPPKMARAKSKVFETPEATKQKLILFYQSRTEEHKHDKYFNSRAKLSVRMALRELLEPFPFELLPVEIREEVVKNLREEDLKNGRLVCKEWNLLCRRYLNCNPREITDINAKFVANSYMEFHELLINQLYLVKLKSQNFIGGENIHILNFKNPSITEENLEWLIKSCPNVQEIHIRHLNYSRSSRKKVEAGEQRFIQFLRMIGKKLSNCLHLKKLEICAGRMMLHGYNGHGPYTEGEVTFDCASLKSCTKLEYFHIYSTVPFHLRNCYVLPESLVRFRFIMMLTEEATPKYFDKIYADLRKQFRTRTGAILDEYNLTGDDRRIIPCYFRRGQNATQFKIVPGQRSEFHVFLGKLYDMMDMFRSYHFWQGKGFGYPHYLLVSSSVLQFSVRNPNAPKPAEDFNATRIRRVDYNDAKEGEKTILF